MERIKGIYCIKHTFKSGNFKNCLSTATTFYFVVHFGAYRISSRIQFSFFCVKYSGCSHAQMKHILLTTLSFIINTIATVSFAHNSDRHIYHAFHTSVNFYSIYTLYERWVHHLLYFEKKFVQIK